MTTYLPPEVQAGLDAARKRAWRNTHRLRVHDGSNMYRVIAAWEGGFSLDKTAAQHLRGRVDLYDGATRLAQCLIMAAEEDGEEMRFEYKQLTGANDEQPLDFAREADAPVALIAAD